MSETRTAAALGALLRESTPPGSPRQHLEGRARLVDSLAQPQGARRRPARAAIGLALAAAVAAIALVLARRHAPTPLAWHVEQGSAGAQGYVGLAAGEPSARLVFDDGSRVVLAPGSRGRVAAATARVAEVVLEQGRAQVHVEHRDGTTWVFDAGPYAVRVTGTDFVLAWAADVETLDVWMRSGRVVVTGPVLGEALTLATGQHLVARLRERSAQIDATPEPPAGVTPPAPPTPTSTDPAAPAPSAVVPPPGATASAPSPAWSKLVATGDYARVVREAEAEGIARALGGRPLADLRALGDAARYAGRADLARRAYTAVRARFPSSGEARTAAFLIGRVAEEQDHAVASALRWYDTYLAEAPAGAFAGDALGRKMVLVSTTQGRDAARPLAERYLQRFPGGPYAGAARDLSP